jgi:hypothetical protein
MSEHLKSVMDIIRSDEKLHEEAIRLALRSKDETLSVVERMAALVHLSAMIQVVETEIPKKPEYKWVNGAKVRVK